MDKITLELTFCHIHKWIFKIFLGENGFSILIMYTSYIFFGVAIGPAILEIKYVQYSTI